MKLKILYGIQCTGNGHITRSKEIIKFLEENYEVEVDVCLSGKFSQIDTTDLNIKYKFEGLGFDLKNGGISLWQTFKKAKIIPFLK